MLDQCLLRKLLNLKMLPFLTITLAGTYLNTTYATQAEEFGNESRATTNSTSLDFSQITETDNGHFYVAQFKDRPLKVVMERITYKSHKDWKTYAKVQGNGRVLDIVSQKLKSGTTADGAGHFESVLDYPYVKDRETWVTYITDIAQPKFDEHKFELYNVDQVYKPRTAAGNIKMFMTVTSSPNAKITTHMGISLSAESVFQTPRYTNLSMDLHAFAAKVMLKRNPERLFMITSPTGVMENIIAQNVPQGVHIGTKQMFEYDSKVQATTFEEFKTQNASKIEEEIERISRIAREHLEWSHQIDDLEEFEALPLTNRYLTKTDQGYALSPEKIEAYQQVKILKMFEDFRALNFWYSLKKSYKGNDFDGFLKAHPPILSVDQVKCANHSLTILNPKNDQETLVAFNDNNPSYRWFFRDCYQPTGLTHSVAVDLRELAKARDLADLTSPK